MVIRIQKTASDLHFNSPDLITRPLGRKMYEKVRNMLKNVSHGETVILDFSGIMVVDTSFIDEFLVRLINDSMNEQAGFFIKLTNISEISDNNIDAVLRSYSNYKNKKYVVNTSEIRQNNNFFLGPLTDTERDVVHYIRINKSASLQDLSEFTGLSKKQLSELLQDLCGLRVLKSDGGIYFSI